MLSSCARHHVSADCIRDPCDFWPACVGSGAGLWCRFPYYALLAGLTGINHASIIQVLAWAKDNAVLNQTSVTVSMVLVSNEHAVDLLNAGGGGSLRVVDDTHGNGQLPGLSWFAVSSLSQAMALLAVGLASARSGATGHVIVQVKVNVSCKLDALGGSGRGDEIREGLLTLVDLVGSDVGAGGDIGVKEKAATKAAQQSLAALQEVVLGLGGTGHLPARASVLTRLLASSFGITSATLDAAGRGNRIGVKEKRSHANSSPGTTAGDATLGPATCVLLVCVRVGEAATMEQLASLSQRSALSALAFAQVLHRCFCAPWCLLRALVFCERSSDGEPLLDPPTLAVCTATSTCYGEIASV